MSTEQKTIIEILADIQQGLKAPKDLRNNFGGYNYRSAESILESVKPVLKEFNAAITISDDLVLIGDRYYIRATATLQTAVGSMSTTAFAREELEKKGMDGSQITGASSSYARKYALNGLLAIDDTKDSDATNAHGKSTPSAPTSTPPAQKAAPAKKTTTTTKAVTPEPAPSGTPSAGMSPSKEFTSGEIKSESDEKVKAKEFFKAYSWDSLNKHFVKVERKAFANLDDFISKTDIAAIREVAKRVKESLG